MLNNTFCQSPPNTVSKKQDFSAVVQNRCFILPQTAVFFFLYIHKHIIVDLVWSQGDNTFPSCDSEKSLLTAPEFWGWVSVSIETFPKWSNSQKLLSIRGFLRKQLVARARDLWFDFSSWHSLLCRMHEVKSNSTIFKTKCEMSEIRLSMGENEKLSLYRSTGVACLSLFSSTRYGCRNV